MSKFTVTGGKERSNCWNDRPWRIARAENSVEKSTWI